jgi:L-malate glycosyltransferase
VHAWEIYSNVFGLPGATLARVPLRIGSRRGLGGPPAVRRLQTLACRTAHCMVANSRAAANQLIAEGIPEQRIDIIPNGIDLSIFPVRRDFSRARTITMVACLRDGKRVDVLIAAAARIIARHPDVEFRIVGDGPCRERLVEQAAATGVLPRIRFMGHRDDVPAILSASDLFVLPSESEASPNVILEAMAAALPVVASRVGGIPELVDDGVTGHLVPPADSPGLAAALLDLLDHPARRAAFGRAGRARIEQQYSFDRMVAQFESLYVSRSAGSADASVRDSERNQCPA